MRGLGVEQDKPPVPPLSGGAQKWIVGLRLRLIRPTGFTTLTLILSHQGRGDEPLNRELKNGLVSDRFCQDAFLFQRGENVVGRACKVFGTGKGEIGFDGGGCRLLTHVDREHRGGMHQRADRFDDLIRRQACPEPGRRGERVRG